MTNLKSTDIGTPCRLTTLIGRIVEHDPDGSKGAVNGVVMHSIVLVGTPHGSVIKSGISHLEPLNREELEKLALLEREAKNMGILYQHHPGVIELIK